MFRVNTKLTPFSKWHKVYTILLSIATVSYPVFITISGVLSLTSQDSPIDFVNLDRSGLKALLFFTILWVIAATFMRKTVWKNMLDGRALEYNALGFQYYYSSAHETIKEVPYQKIQSSTRLSKTRLHVQFIEAVDQYIIRTKHGPVTVHVSEFKISGNEKDLNELEKFLQQMGFQTADYGRTGDDFRNKALGLILITILILVFFGIIYLNNAQSTKSLYW